MTLDALLWSLFSLYAAMPSYRVKRSANDLWHSVSYNFVLILLALLRASIAKFSAFGLHHIAGVYQSISTCIIKLVTAEDDADDLSEAK